MTSKKNWTMRIAVLMFALVLMTSCFVGGTFAKYVTSGSGSDTARVAKFGVKVEATGDVFAKTYDAADPKVNDYKGDVIAQSVISAGDDNVVAPGTSKTGSLAISVTGTPEVAVTVAHTATVALNDKWVDANGNYYCPLKITVGSDTVYGMDYNSATDFAAAVKGKIDSTENYQAKTDLSSAAVAKAPVISWAWDFVGTDNKQTDEKDTYLGDQAAEGKAATITITVATTVTQID